MAAEVAKQLSYSNVVQQDPSTSGGGRSAELKAQPVPATDQSVPNHSESKENVKPVEHNEHENAADDGSEERTKIEKPVKKVEYVPASPPKDNPWLRNKKASANTTNATSSISSGQQTAAVKSQKQAEKPKTVKSPRNNKSAPSTGGGGHKEKSSGRGRAEKHEAPKDDVSKSGKKDSTESKPPPRKKVYESAPPPKVNAWSKGKTSPAASIEPPVFNSDVNMTNISQSTNIAAEVPVVVQEPVAVAAVLPPTNAAPPAPPAAVPTVAASKGNFLYFYLIFINCHFQNLSKCGWLFFMFV